MVSKVWAAFGIGIFFGSLNSLVLKTMYQQNGLREDGSHGLFFKPWAMTAAMFIAMLLAFPAYFYLQRRKAPSADEKTTPLLNTDAIEEEPCNGITPRLVAILWIPSVADLLGTVLQQIGLLYTTVSVFQMLKGSVMFFSAVMSVLFLDRKLVAFNWIGLFICVLGLTCVGFASVFATSAKPVPVSEDLNRTNSTSFHHDAAAADADPMGNISLQDQLFGITVILAGQVVCAVQYVVEEFLLKPPNDAPVLALVGLEGAWGTLMMVFLLPFMTYYMKGDDAYGSYENMYDTVFRIEHDSFIMWTMLAFVVSVLIYNIAAVMVTAEASCIHHTFLDATRTVVIWVISVCMFYMSSHGQIGEPLTKWSYLQGFGFFLLILGELVYDRQVELPLIPYPDESEEKLLDELPPLHASMGPYSPRASPRASPANSFFRGESKESPGSPTAMKLDMDDLEKF